jgi:hypothetical protein
METDPASKTLCCFQNTRWWTEPRNTNCNTALSGPFKNEYWGTERIISVHKQHSWRFMRGMEVCRFLALVINGDEQLASCSNHFTPTYSDPSTRWMGLRPIPDVLIKRKISMPLPGLEPWSPRIYQDILLAELWGMLYKSFIYIKCYLIHLGPPGWWMDLDVQLYSSHYCAHSLCWKWPTVAQLEGDDQTATNRCNGQELYKLDS